MEKSTMQKLVADELERIPRGPDASPQNLFRSGYQMLRQHSLSQDPNAPPGEAFRQAVEQVRQNHPGFSPTLTDQEYFGWSE